MTVKTVAVHRLWSVDVLRGLAMFLVLVQHPYLLTNRSQIPPLLNFLVWNSTALAALAFVVISGSIYSYSLFVGRDWRTTYKKYIRRALFLLLVAHPLIRMTSYPYFSMKSEIFAWDSLGFFKDFIGLGYIADTIALCILVSPLCIIRTGPMFRGFLIVISLFISPLVVTYIQVEGQGLNIIKEFFFGKWGEPKLFWYPLIPWLAVFLSGSFIGEYLAGL